MNPKLVGITGGMGSGKSTVSRVFQTLGVPVYDSDLRARSIQDSDPDVKNEISNILGAEAYSHKTLDREFVARRVFGNPELLLQLNKIVHPRVAKDFQQWVQDQKDQTYLIKEAALLIESGSLKTLDYLIVVTSPIETRINRILKRDPGRTRSQIEEIVQRQLSENEMLSHADFHIANDGTEMILPKIIALHQQFSASG